MITKFGIRATLQKLDGTIVKTYIVWGKTEDQDMAAQLSHVATETKNLFMCGNVKKVPAIGDSIIISNANWSIKTVEQYMPTATVIAYKIVATN